MIFRSFADSTRRDILKRVCKSDLTITEIARPYSMSFAAIAKHVAVLEKGRLISKRRRGKEQVISANPGTMTLAAVHLQGYERAWKQRYDKLESLLSSATTAPPPLVNTRKDASLVTDQEEYATGPISRRRAASPDRR